MNILVLNSGSSSLKCWYGDVASPIADPLPRWSQQADLKPGAVPLEDLLRQVPGPVDAIGHRIVHGGALRETVVITPAVRQQIAEETGIAPQHNATALRGIDAAMQAFPNVPQVAVFDTAFHATLAPEAYTYPGPLSWQDEGIRRFGFHGVSHGYATKRAAQLLNRPADSVNLITCHLGNGASLAAIAQGRSADTTMGFTPLEGLMMGTRSGSVDPGILIYLMRHHDYTPDQLDNLLNRQSGLLGLSGVSSDLREILAAISDGNAQAQLALDVFLHRLVREIGAMRASIGHLPLHAIVFTGGIGEHAPVVRSRVCHQLSYLDLQCDEQANQNCQPDQDIATPQSPVRVFVIQAREELEIARECVRVLAF